MNAPFAHPAEWHANRRTGIGGSDANIIMAGDAERIHRENIKRGQHAAMTALGNHIAAATPHRGE